MTLVSIRRAFSTVNRHSNISSPSMPRMSFLCRGRRSEEHTSELQSLMRSSYAVFCLKKKNYYNKLDTIDIQTDYCNNTGLNSIHIRQLTEDIVDMTYKASVRHG